MTDAAPKKSNHYDTGKTMIYIYFSNIRYTWKYPIESDNHLLCLHILADIGFYDRRQSLYVISIDDKMASSPKSTCNAYTFQQPNVLIIVSFFTFFFIIWMYV